MTESPEDAARRAATLAQFKAQQENAGKSRPSFRERLSFKLPKWWRRTAYALVASPLLYIGVGEVTGRVNNDPLEVTVPENGSAIIATLREGMARELKSGWCPSEVFTPHHIRYDMCAFQEGVQVVNVRIAQDLYNNLTRLGSASKIDPDVANIQFAFNRGNHWSITPWSSTYDQYWKGVDAAEALQSRIVSGNAPNGKIEPRIDTLSSIVSTLSSVVGDAQQHMIESEGTFMPAIFGSRVDYFRALGTMNAACNYMKAIGQDFKDVEYLQSSTVRFDTATQAVCAAIGDNPMFVLSFKNVPHIQSVISQANFELHQAQLSIAAAPNSPGPVGRSAPLAAPRR